MNQREARRLATRWLAAFARQHGEGETLLGVGPLSDRDSRRVELAFRELAAELEQRAGDRPRLRKADPVDPNQCTIFDEE